MKIKIIAIATAICALFSISTYADDSILKNLQIANESYAAGNYQEAESAYRKMIESGNISSSVLSNLSRTVYREGKLGEAILFMLKAQVLSPRDPEIMADLKFLRGKVIDKVEPAKRGIVQKISTSISSMLSEREIVIAMITLAFISCLIISLRIMMPTPISVTYGTRRTFTVMAIATSILFLIASAQWGYMAAFTSEPGVVSAEEASISSGPGDGNVVIMKLHAGSEFTIKFRNNSGWTRIELTDGRGGWIKEEDIAR